MLTIDSESETDMETRTYIVETAFRCFLGEGFDQVSLNSLIARTGLSKGAFYHYFNSKEDLLNEIADQYLLDYIGKNLNQADVSDNRVSFDQQLDSLIKTMFAFQTSMPHLLKTTADCKRFFHMLFSVLNQNEKLKQNYIKTREKFLSKFEHLLQVAIANHEISKHIDVQQVAVALYATMRGTMFEWSISEEDEIEPLIHANVRCIVDILKIGVKNE